MTKEIWDIDGTKVPINIIKEWRKSNRISIGRSTVTLRIPTVGAKQMITRYRQWAEEWLQKQLTNKPELKERFYVRKYESGYVVNTTHRSYTLKILREDRKTGTASIRGNDIIIKIPLTATERQESTLVEKLTYRAIGKDSLVSVSQRIHAINDAHFQQEIGQIRMKNNSSNWGSCSSGKNINISIKTLFAPANVQDYIFVHELSHLIEMNHSPRYWAVVAKAMPEYKIHAKWIKEYGSTCKM